VEQTRTIDGRVTALRGAVLDVALDGVTLPPIDDALVISPVASPMLSTPVSKWPGDAGDGDPRGARSFGRDRNRRTGLAAVRLRALRGGATLDPSNKDPPRS
jgi:hypothetical protein